MVFTLTGGQMARLRGQAHGAAAPADSSAVGVSQKTTREGLRPVGRLPDESAHGGAEMNGFVGWVRGRRVRAGAIAAITGLASAAVVGAALSGGTAFGDTFLKSAEITYGDDGHIAQQCSGPSSKLHYTVFYPASPGPHPIVFGMSGSGFAGNAQCDSTTKMDAYHVLDWEMKRWATAGYVAVNIQYHGWLNGLYGDLTYPGPGKWSNIADGSVQLDIKPAIEYFFSHNPGQYGAQESQGVIAFGASSGGHDAYMLSLTGVPDHRIWAAVGWSGLPDVSLAGTTARSVFDKYMRTQPGTDVENFGDPEHRIGPTSPPEYVANGTAEFIAAANAEQYFKTCKQLNILDCYERIPNTTQHALAYENYVFTGVPPEITNPLAVRGQTVFDDTIAFANTVLHRSP
jgi:hypothetical protein